MHTSPGRRARSRAGRSGRTIARSSSGTLTLTVTLGLALALAACSEKEAPAHVRPEGLAPGFEEVARAAGLDFRTRFLDGEQGTTFKINLYDHGTGVCIGDYDGDGREDIYLVNQLGANGLFRANGDGTFTDVTEAAGVGLADRICTSASFADYDNDGDQDLFVDSVRGGNVLFRNNGAGTFEDVSEAAGVGLVAHTQGCAFFDYDNDGFLDLYITNTAKWTHDELEPEGRYRVGVEDLVTLVASPPEFNVLYRNRGDGTFEDVTAATGVGGTGWGGDIATFDVDLDGDQDLFVTNMFGQSFFFRNEDGKRFEDVTEKALGRTSWGAVGCKPLDFDGDGDLDLYVTDMHSDMWMPASIPAYRMEEEVRYAGPEGPMVDWGLMSDENAAALKETVSASKPGRGIFGNTLYRNLGGFRFEEIAEQARAETLWPWSIAAADFDMNGYEDVFIASGMGFPYFPWRNALLMNYGNGKFERCAAAEGIEPRPGGPTLDLEIHGQRASRSSRSGAVFDYDGDGRLDLVVNNFNERVYLYRNRFPQQRWIALRLTGTRSNRDAIGALATVVTGDRKQVRQVHCAGGYLAQSTRTLYFGLPGTDPVKSIHIRWPSGIEMELGALAVDTLHDIVEKEDEPK